MNKKCIIALVLMCAVSLTAAFAQSSQTANSESQVVEAEADSGLAGGIKYLAAALAVGIACIGGGLAVGKIGAAAMGAMSENAELSGKAIPFVGLAEGICLWGFLVALFIVLL